MCGIAVILTSKPLDVERTIDEMTDALIHRGPDDRGTVVIREEGIALGMRRLSILDIEGGHQPMWNEDSSLCLVFNGEIYNFAELRRELAGRGHRFQTDHSDTEVLVHGFEEWRHELFPRLNGMFAVAIWDRRRRELTLARDRMGKKPLYIAEIPGGYAVASELKALLKHPGVPREVDAEALEQYLEFDYVIGPRTILRSVRKLRAAHSATIADGELSERCFWQPSFEELTDSEDDLQSRLDDLLDQAVERRMVADVPVGLFLSGGLDSTTVGHYMCRHSDDVHSFSIAFEDSRFDESAYAQLAATSLGTRHHVELFSQDRVRELIPRVADVLDEPMGDQSIFPTYLLSMFTREHVKVALGGDGGDELLMGYKAHIPLKLAWELDSVPSPIRRAVAGSARRLPTHVGGRPIRGVQFARLLDLRPTERLLTHLGAFKRDARSVLSPDMRAALTRPLFEEPRHVILDGTSGIDGAAETTVAYLRGYLEEDILVKVDRASMAASLEVRAPLLDPGVVEFLLSVPASLKLHGRTDGKYLLKRLMRGKIPSEIIDREKFGFGVPLNAWLRESLLPTVREYLAPDRLRAAGFFDERAVAALVDAHAAGRRDHGREIWLLLQFELWRERWLG